MSIDQELGAVPLTAPSPVKSDARPDVDVYDPRDKSLVKVPFDAASELKKGGYTVGLDALTAQLNDSKLSKGLAALFGAVNVGSVGSFGALKALAAKSGSHQDLSDLRQIERVQAEHPGYSAAGSAAGLLAQLPLGGGAYAAGSIGAKATGALAEKGLAGALAAKGANILAAGVPAAAVQGALGAGTDAVVGHREIDARTRRQKIVESPITAELLAAGALNGATDMMLANGVFGGALGAVHLTAKTGKGALGLFERYAGLEREQIAVKPLETGPRVTSYTRVDHSVNGEPAMADVTRPNARVIEGGVLGEGPAQLTAEAGPNGVPDLPGTFNPNADPLGASAPIRPTPRPEHLRAMEQEHGVISLPGDVALPHEVSAGIPRAGVEPSAVAEPVPEKIEYATDPKLQRLFEEAQASAAQAEKMAAERIAGETEIPKRDVGAAPVMPTAPEFDAATVEPVFSYNGEYKQKHKIELVRQWINDRLERHSPEALEMWNKNRELTGIYNKLDKDRTGLNWYAEREAARAEKVALKAKLREMVPRRYDPLTGEYAPGFGDLLDEYRSVIRGDVKVEPKITFGPKGDPVAEAQHIENLKAYNKEKAVYDRAVTKAEAAHVRAVKQAEMLERTEAKRVAQAVEKSEAALKKVEQRIADAKAKFEAKVAADQFRAEKKLADAIERNKAKAARDAAKAVNAQERAAIKAAERRANEIAQLEKKAADRVLREQADTERQIAAGTAKSERAVAAEQKRVAAEAERAKTKAANEARKAAREADKYAKAQQKAADAAKPRWEEKKVTETDDPEFGRKVETMHLRHENGKVSAKRTIKITAPKKPPQFIAGDYKPYFSTSSIALGGGIGSAVLGPHTGGLIAGGMVGTNAFIKNVLNNESVHNAFAAALKHLETSIGPTIAKLANQRQQRGRRQAAQRTEIGRYQDTVKAIGYGSQNPDAVHSYIDAEAANLAALHPELTNAVKTVTTGAVQALNDEAPKKPYDAPLQDRDYHPPRAAQVAFMRKYQILGNPREALASGDPAAIRLVSMVYPNLYREYCSQTTQYLAQHKKPIFNRPARLVSQFLGVNVRPIDDPAALQRLQATGGPQVEQPNQQKPIGRTSAPTRAASQRATIDAPAAQLSSFDL